MEWSVHIDGYVTSGNTNVDATWLHIVVLTRSPPPDASLRDNGTLENDASYAQKLGSMVALHITGQGL